MACLGCLDADCHCIEMVIAEQLADVRGQYEPSHAKLVVSLNPADHEVETLGYARVRVAQPGFAARYEGTAVAVESVAGVPDPRVVLVQEDPTFSDDHEGRRIIPILRASLPLWLKIDDHGHVESRSLPNLTARAAAESAKVEAQVATLGAKHRARIAMPTTPPPEPDVELIDDDGPNPELEGAVVDIPPRFLGEAEE